MDCWASIEHELKYKHDIANPELMQQELKHCSDQIASTDLSLSTSPQMLTQMQIPTQVLALKNQSLQTAAAFRSDKYLDK